MWKVEEKPNAPIRPTPWGESGVRPNFLYSLLHKLKIWFLHFWKMGWVAKDPIGQIEKKNLENFNSKCVKICGEAVKRPDSPHLTL